MCSECGNELMPSEAKNTPDSCSGPNKPDSFSGLNPSDPCSKEPEADFSQTGEGDDSLASRSKRLAEELDSDFEESDPACRKDVPWGQPGASMGSVFGREKSANASIPDNPHLEIKYNLNLFFVRGASSVMRLRITPGSKLPRSILLFMETQDRSRHVRREIPVTERLRKGFPIEVRLSYCPEEASGREAFFFFVVCNLETKTEYYQFTVEHKIYTSDQSANTVANIIFQDIKASHAAEINVGNFGKAIKDIMDRKPTVNELIDSLNDRPPAFVRQELRETSWRPRLIEGLPYPEDRLILEWNGISLFLIGRRNVKLGRSPELCDLVIRTRDGGRLGPHDKPNNTVSRIHTEILYNGDFVQLLDKSRWGTYVNGLRPDGVGVEIPENATIEFGDIHFQASLQYCRKRQSHTYCQTCIASRIKSMTFVRKDRDPECYLLVWQCCELGRVIPELSDWTVFFRDDAFLIRTPEQKFHYLRPGIPIKSNQLLIKVNYFQQ